jgi:cytochrome c biogenesis factor
MKMKMATTAPMMANLYLFTNASDLLSTSSIATGACSVCFVLIFLFFIYYFLIDDFSALFAKSTAKVIKIFVV